MLPNGTTVPTRAWYTAKISLRKFEVKKYDVSETVPGYLPGNGV